MKMGKLRNRLVAFVMSLMVAISTFGASSMTVFAMAPTSGSGFTSDMSYRNWCQKMFTGSGLRSGGCRVVAFTKMLYEAGFTQVENPQHFYEWCRDNKVKGAFSSTGYENGSFGDSLNPFASAHGGSVEQVTRVDISKKSKSEVAPIIMNYINQGYYCILAGGGHTVYVGRNDSISAGEPVILESSFSTALGPEWYGTYNNIVKYLSSKYSSGNKYTGLRVYKITAPAGGGNNVDNTQNSTQLKTYNGSIIAEGQYILTSGANSNYVVDLYGMYSSSGSNVNCWEYNGSDAQIWNITSAGDSYYYLEPACAPGMRLDVYGAGNSNFTNVQIWTANTSSAQKWKFVSNGDGSYRVVPQCAEGISALDLNEANATNGQNIQIYAENNSAAQKWKLKKVDKVVGNAIVPETYNNISVGEPAQATTVDDTEIYIGKQVREGRYNIVSAANNNYVLDVYGAGTSNADNVNLWEYNGSDAQKWDIVYAGGGYYYINPVCAPGMRLDVYGMGTADKTNVQIWEANESSAQKWQILDAGNGYYYFMPECGAQKTALDLQGAKAKSGQNVYSYTWNQSVAQKWKLQMTE